MGSSRPEVLCKKGVVRNFTKFTGKQLCQTLYFNKVAGLQIIETKLLTQDKAKSFLQQLCEHRSSRNIIKALTK